MKPIYQEIGSGELHRSVLGGSWCDLNPTCLDVGFCFRGRGRKDDAPFSEEDAHNATARAVVRRIRHRKSTIALELKPCRQQDGYHLLHVQRFQSKVPLWGVELKNVGTML